MNLFDIFWIRIGISILGTNFEGGPGQVPVPRMPSTKSDSAHKIKQSLRSYRRLQDAIQEISYWVNTLFNSKDFNLQWVLTKIIATKRPVGWSCQLSDSRATGSNLLTKNSHPLPFWYRVLYNFFRASSSFYELIRISKSIYHVGFIEILLEIETLRVDHHSDISRGQ